MSHEYPTRFSLKKISHVSHVETRVKSVVKSSIEDKECFDLCLENWEKCFPEELCIQNAIYVVLIVLKSAITKTGKIKFPVVVKVGYTGNRKSGTLFERLKEQFRDNDAVDIIPLMVMQARKTIDVAHIEQEIHKTLKPKQIQIACTPSKYVGLPSAQPKISREFYICDETVVDDVYVHCVSSGLEIILNKITEETSIDSCVDESRVKSIYGEDINFLLLEATDSLTKKEVTRIRQCYK